MFESPRIALVAPSAYSADRLELSLQEIFSESLADVCLRELTSMETLLAAHRGRCVVFGAGHMGGRVVAALRALGIRPLAISDNNSALWGTLVAGLPVIPPDEAGERFGKNAVFFIAIRNENHWFRETFLQLGYLGCSYISSSEPVAWRFPEIFPPFLPYDLPHKVYMHSDAVLRAAEIWADDLSRAEYLAQVQLRTLGDPFPLAEPALEESYFLPGVFQLEPDDVFLDCGAFDGDTIRSVIDLNREFTRIDAVEADSHSFARLASYVASLSPDLRQKIHLHQCAVGSTRGSVRFDDTGSAVSKISDEGKILVDMVPIDLIFARKRVSMIKMDIEGGECDALLGAKEVIRRDRPILAICVYHSQQDLWRLPLLMRDLCPEHRMYLQAYRGDGIQTVAYAVPPERVLGTRQVRQPRSLDS